MFLSKADESFLNSLRSYDNDFYNELTTTKPRILYTLVKNGQEIIYEYITPERYAHFYVDNMGRIKIENDYDKALLVYIYNIEKNLTKDQLKEIYKDIYPIIEGDFVLSKADIRYRNDHLQEYNELLTSIIDTTEEQESTPVITEAEPVKVEFEISCKTYNYYYVRLRAGFKKLKYVQDVSSFLDSSLSETTLTLDINAKASPDSYDEVTLNALKILKKYGRTDINSYYSYQYEKNGVYLPENNIGEFLAVLKGKNIKAFQNTYHIDEEIGQFKIDVSDDGKVSIDPPIDDNLDFSGDYYVIIDHGNNTITLGKFASKKQKQLLEFIQYHPNFKFELFAREFASDILPQLKNDINISQKFKDKHPSLKTIIEYYIEFDETSSLVCKTILKQADKTISKDDLIQSTTGQILYNAFLDKLTQLNLIEEGKISDQEIISVIFSEDLHLLNSVCTLFVSEDILSKNISSVGKVNINVSSGIDWFNFEVSSPEFSQDELNDILKAYKKKKKFIRLNNRIVSLDDQNGQVLKSLADDFSIESINTKKLPLYQALKLPNYENGNMSISYSKTIKDLLTDIKSYKTSNLNLDPQLQSQLRSYQLEGVKWMNVLSTHKLSGILADDMGLGKTLQTITLMSLRKSDKPSLIVCPKSLIYNWQNEFDKWNSKEVVYVLGLDKKERADILNKHKNEKVVFVISYESLRIDIDLYKDIQFDYIVLDEAQNIANATSLKTRAVKTLNGEHKFVLTGTPIQNSLLDLWSIFDFSMPGYLQSFSDFKAEYSSYNLEESKKETLMKKTSPFILRRNKNDVLKDLPPKEEQVMIISMNDEQQKLYDAYLQNVKNSLDDKTSKIAILGELTRLRQLCVDPAMFIENFEDISDKLTETVNIIKSLTSSDHKVLVFSTFVKSLEHLNKILNDENISSYHIYGDTPAKDRISFSDKFNTEEDVKVMLVSLKAGGTGLNLIGADNVIILDPWWNVQAENQAMDRAHRIGQDKPVTVYKMVTKGTIEEKVIQLQNLKKDLAKVVSDGDEMITSINTDDIKYLLS